MGNSRKIVRRLQRISGAEAKTARPPIETPNAPKDTALEDNRARHLALKPEELITLRKIVLKEQLSAFTPDPPPPPNRGDRPKKSGPGPAPGPAQPPDLASPDPARDQLPPTPEPEPARKDHIVSNIETILKEAMQIDGAIGVALVDYTSGMTLGQSGGATLNLDVAAAGNTEVVRAKLRTMEALGLHDGIEDILITLSTQYHLIRLLNDRSGLGLFLYLALDKSKANLALARHKLANLEKLIEI